MSKLKTETLDVKTNQTENILELSNITKTFLGGKIIANDAIDIAFKRNEIHSIVGENGSGKSTLMNIIFGLYKQDIGNIFLNSEKVDMNHPGASKKHKIGMVHQHFHLVENFTVLENVILGQESANFESAFSKKEINQKIEINEKKVKEMTTEIKLISNDKNSEKTMEYVIDSIEKRNSLKVNLENFKINRLNNYVGLFGKLNKNNLKIKFELIQDKYNINLNPDAKISTLSVGQRQMVEIMKVLWSEKDIIVFDEPTATLSVVEISKLLNTISKLKKEGKTIIFISHKLKEVKAISDRISILKKGKLIGTYINDENFNISVMSEKMIGEQITSLNFEKRDIQGKEIFNVMNLTYVTKSGFKALDNVSFTIKKGEIFGLAGIEGNGQEEIIKILTNLKKPESGRVLFKNKILIDKNGYKLSNLDRKKIVSHVPIDRLKHGVIPTKNLEFNAKLSDFDTNLFKNVKLPEFTDKIISDMNVEGAFNHDVEIRNLSGGNQQKFIVGRELFRPHEIFIAGHPTRGLDILAVHDIYEKMIANSSKGIGKTTLLYSLELSELISVCDRMAIMYKGKIVSIVDPKKETMNSISKMMLGEVA